MENVTYTVEVTLAGKTKEVEFHLGRNNFADASFRLFAAQCGNGVKMHAASMRMWIFDTELEAVSKFYYDRKNIVELHDGRFGYLSRNAMVRNREARIVGWAEDFIGTDLETKQNYYGALKEAN